MSLRIGHLDTTCHVSEGHLEKARAVDDLARGNLANDLGEHLGPSLARQPAIVRIRRLSLRVVIPASECDEESLSLAWRRAFSKALFAAIAYPAGAGPVEVFREDSLASFIASAISDLLNGIASDQWQYREFKGFFDYGSTQGALALISEWPIETLSILLELERRGILPRLLARFDERALESLFDILIPRTATSSGALSIQDVIAAAKLALGGPPEKPIALRSRAYALTLFVQAQRKGLAVPSARALYHALLAIAVLLNPTVFWPDMPAPQLAANENGVTNFAARSTELAGLEVLARLASPRWTDMLRSEASASRVPMDVITFLDRLGEAMRQYWQAPFLSRIPAAWPSRSAPGESPSNRSVLNFDGSLSELNQLLTNLAGQWKLPAPIEPTPQTRWISTEWCGLFFLIGPLARLGWTRAWEKLAAFETGGVACLIAGVALAIAVRLDPAAPGLDPGIALFAGYKDDPDLAHLSRVFQDFPHEVRLSVLEAARLENSVEDAESWARTFDRLAARLVMEFGSRIRGFRKAPRESLVRSFLAQPGRVCVERERLVVFPNPNPFHVALHISGLDESIEAVDWIGCVRVEFDLGVL